MKRTTIFVTPLMVKETTAAAKPDGLTMSALIRIFIREGLARRKRQQWEESK